MANSTVTLLSGLISIKINIKVNKIKLSLKYI